MRVPLPLLAATAALTLGACGNAAVKGASGSAGGGPTATSAGTAGACPAPPPPSPDLPQQPGCYSNYMGAGWVAVPCLCDLWIQNTTPGPATASVGLAVTPPDQVPMLAGPLDVGIAFDDADGSWLATWTKQTGNGSAFTVASDGGTTTVRMGQSDLSLASVPLAPCETRKARAQVTGSTYDWTARLDMQAVLADGTVFATVDAGCANPPPEM